MWHRRSSLRPTVDGGADGPARGSPSAKCAGVVRDESVERTASDRCLCPVGAGAAGAAEVGACKDPAAAGEPREEARR